VTQFFEILFSVVAVVVGAGMVAAVGMVLLSALPDFPGRARR
jgi:hypothetical protein